MLSPLSLPTIFTLNPTFSRAFALCSVTAQKWVSCVIQMPPPLQGIVIATKSTSEIFHIFLALKIDAASVGVHSSLFSVYTTCDLRCGR